MSWSKLSRLAFAASIVLLVGAQYSGWQENQANTTICTWQNPRVATMRDTAYVDGGWLWWKPGMTDGTSGSPQLDGNPLGYVFLLNFSKPFNTSDNASEIFDLLPKGGDGNSLNNLFPNYFDGAILANDDEFFMYGGLLTPTDAFSSTPNANSVFGYQMYQYGAQKAQWSQGFFGRSLPSDTMSRYLAYGGAASAPSENKGYYFSGLHSHKWGELYVQSPNESVSALDTAKSLITLDMTTQQDETWSNKTLPDDIKGRGGADLVWVPVGEQGILVALGGVVYPDFSNPNYTSANEGQSEVESPLFMTNIDIYDIAGDTWYKQQTIDGPPQLALGCAIVAVAQDTSSYNIYYYGGYDGIHMTQSFSDDVWILSLPSFVWNKIPSDNTAHARAGHRCVKPYPDQMIVIGGYPSLGGTGSNCIDGGILRVFNLTEGTWMDRYDPKVYHDYGVPEIIHRTIGGDAAGTATMTVPTPSGWTTPDLSKVFETKYPTSKIATYYPYKSYNSTGNRQEVAGSTVPSWLAPVLGVVLGLVFISAIVVAILLYRRRKLLRRGGASEGATEDNGNRILNWMRGQDVQSHKAQTVTSEEPSKTLHDDADRSIGGQTPYQGKVEMVHAPSMDRVLEMPYTPVFEMGDTSKRPELDDTGLTPIDIINKHSHFARSPGGQSMATPTNPSSYSNFSVSQDHASISTNSQSRANFSMSEGRPDSPALGTVQGPTPPEATRPTPDHRVVSDLSSISQREVAHLRNVSDASVSTAAGEPPTPIVDNSAPMGTPGAVSPPSEGIDGREEYFQDVGQTLTGGGPSSRGASPLRRSVFVESQDDLGGKKRNG